jgi:hypothetical protein
MLEVFEETEAGSAGTQLAEGYSDVGTPNVPLAPGDHTLPGALDEAASPRTGGAVLTVVRDVGLLNAPCARV